ncbi:MAG: AAA family ATPase [Lachnospiraceae bacterium]|nr:AAA family ATPase [Lachnospiraceae bacterium]
MEHYITEIKIEELRHLSNLVIHLDADKRQHLMITGKNGSGKTSLLEAVSKYLSAINDGNLMKIDGIYQNWLGVAEKELKNAKTEAQKIRAEKNYQEKLNYIRRYKNGVEICFNDDKELEALYMGGRFITAYFPAQRKSEFLQSKGVENIKLEESYKIESDPGRLLLKYMVHLKTQQSYARNEGDTETVDRIQIWFDRFEEALKIMLDDETLSLEYDYKKYDFIIHEDGRKPFGLNELSDGYSSVLYIVSNLIIRMDQNWLLSGGTVEYNTEGIVLIDELETHLHIELQKKIMPFLVSFFPNLQFIVSTHSPYILNSVSNAKAYDLERCMEIDNLSLYSADGLAEGYFEADEYSADLRGKIERYRTLVDKSALSNEERAERAKLRCELKDIPGDLAPEAKEQFEEIEGKRWLKKDNSERYTEWAVYLENVV